MILFTHREGATIKAFQQAGEAKPETGAVVKVREELTKDVSTVEAVQNAEELVPNWRGDSCGREDSSGHRLYLGFDRA